MRIEGKGQRPRRKTTVVRSEVCGRLISDDRLECAESSCVLRSSVYLTYVSASINRCNLFECKLPRSRFPVRIPLLFDDALN